MTITALGAFLSDIGVGAVLGGFAVAVVIFWH